MRAPVPPAARRQRGRGVPPRVEKRHLKAVLTRIPFVVRVLICSKNTFNWFFSHLYSFVVSPMFALDCSFYGSSLLVSDLPLKQGANVSPSLFLPRWTFLWFFAYGSWILNCYVVELISRSLRLLDSEVYLGSPWLIRDILVSSSLHADHWLMWHLSRWTIQRALSFSKWLPSRANAISGEAATAFLCWASPSLGAGFLSVLSRCQTPLF